MRQSNQSNFQLGLFLRVVLIIFIIVTASSAGRSQQPTPQSKPEQPLAPSIPFAPPAAQQPARQVTPLALDEAVRLAGAQASSFQQARLNELIAAEDARQARLAFLPRVVSTFSHVYNSPALGAHPAGTPREMSFINANAITEYEALLGLTGDIDTSGRLRATLRRSGALLEAARAGTEVARRALAQAVNEAYFGLALAAARRRSAEQSLTAASEFEQITQLLLDAGEVAEVDLTRARLQTATRRDEAEQARAAESVAADSLRIFVGYDFTAPIATTDIAIASPDLTELERFTSETIARRPELAQFEAERRAAEQEVKIAHADRLPQVSYFINSGFDTGSLKPSPLKMHTGVLASISVTIPIFDWGASRSRELQARLRARAAESQRELALRSFAQQFYTARAQALSAAARARILQSSIADAQRNVQTSIARYRGGEASIVEVTDAQTTLATQRAALFQALFDYQVARAHLAQAAGQ
ncbi:MAG TPA: TolC family protein [Blastocatellia bacterium]|jgi:outer membrane protein TolC